MFPSKLLLIFLCIVGCIYQIVDISNRYLKYTTSSKVKISIVYQTKLPSISVCWYLFSVMKKSDENKLQPGDWEKFNNMLANLTVSQIFNITSKTDDIMKECAIRKPGSFTYRIPLLNQSECSSMFRIKKYVHRINMCYMLTPYNEETYDFRETTLTPSNAARMYQIYFNSRACDNSTLSSVYVHTKMSSQLFDSIFTSDDWHTEPGQVTINYTPYSVHKLPSPYDTRCQSIPNYKTREEYHLDRLNNVTMENMNYVHTLQHIYEPYDYRMFNTHALRDPNISAQFERLNKRNKRYDISSCYLEYTVPKKKYDDMDEIFLIVEWPQDPGTDLSTVPDYVFIDFLIYICSSIGIWLGLSIYTLIDTLSNTLHFSCCRNFMKKMKLTRNETFTPNIQSRLHRHILLRKRLFHEIDKLKLVNKRQDKLITFLIERRKK